MLPTSSWHIVLVAENILCVIIYHQLVFLCTSDHFVIDYYGSRGAHTHGGTFATAPNAVGVFALAFRSTISLIIQIFCARFLNAYIVLSTRFDLA